MQADTYFILKKSLFVRFFSKKRPKIHLFVLFCKKDICIFHFFFVPLQHEIGFLYSRAAVCCIGAYS